MLERLRLRGKMVERYRYHTCRRSKATRAITHPRGFPVSSSRATSDNVGAIWHFPRVQSLSENYLFSSFRGCSASV